LEKYHTALPAAWFSDECAEQDLRSES